MSDCLDSAINSDPQINFQKSRNERNDHKGPVSLKRYLYHKNEDWNKTNV